MSMANQIKNLRIISGLSQSELASKLNTTKQTIYKYENGIITNIPFDKIEKMADIFDVSPSTITGWIESPCPICGLQFTQTIEDYKIHEEIHKKCLKAIEKFGFFWTYLKRENEKMQAWSILNDKNATTDEKVTAAENMCKAYFSRSLETNQFSLNHINFNQYVSKLLNQEHFKERFAEIYDILFKKYGASDGISDGKTIWNMDLKEIQFTDETIEESLEYSKYNNIKPITTKRFPMLGEIACGKPKMCSEEYETFIEASSEIKADFCLTAKGDSMINARIFDGDVVFIRSQPNVENGEIAAVIIDDEATLKRVYVKSDTIILRPENPLYDDIILDISETDKVRILGKAVAFMSNL